MNLLLDTHLLLWMAAGSARLPDAAGALLEDRENVLWFSSVSIWEVAIKSGLGRADFVVDPQVLRRGLAENDYRELPLTAIHAAAVAELPPLHGDPFDRALVAQARREGFVLVTHDPRVAQYGALVRLV